MQNTLDRSKASIKHIDFKNTCSALSIDFVFYEGQERYHLVNREIDLCIIDDDDDEVPHQFPIYYYNIDLHLDIAEPTPMEISKAITNFLGKHKMYLKKYWINHTTCYVAYKTPEEGEKLLYDLPHNPFRHEQVFHIEAEIQLEENIDYKKLLDIKIKDPIETITEKEITDLGYAFTEPGISGFAILSEEDYEAYYG